MPIISVCWRTVPRVADLELDRLLRATGAAVIEGPRGCGTTETARRAAQSDVLFDVDDEARAAALLDPDLVFAGPRPRFLDEWQLVPAAWNRVRRAVDANPDLPEQFLLTGSAAPSDDVTRHAGALRFSRLHMRPMSVFEGGRSTGEVSLARLLAGEEVAAPDSGLPVADVAGGWAAFVVTLGPGAIDEAAASLLRARARVDPERHGQPRALVAVTGWGDAYRRPDGVTVVPIGSLGP